MSFNVINNEAFEFHEHVKNDDKNYLVVSFGKIKDYKLDKSFILETVVVEQIIELKNYIDGKEYVSIDRVFSNPFPIGIKMFINMVRQSQSLPPVID